MAIEVNNLAYAYPDNLCKQVLKIPSWTVASGEKLFLQGSSGSGKSTFLNLLGGILTGRNSRAGRAGRLHEWTPT